MSTFWKQGEPKVWATAAALSATLLMIATLLVVVLVNGLGYFWPSDLSQVTLKDGSRLMGEIVAEEDANASHGERLQFKVGNRDIYGQDYRWVERGDIASLSRPGDAAALERREHGNFYGFLKSLSLEGLKVQPSVSPWRDLERALSVVAHSRDRLADTEQAMSKLNGEAESLRLKIQKMAYNKGDQARIDALTRERERLLSRFNALLERFNSEIEELRAPKAVFVDATGGEKEIALIDIVRAWQPNDMGVFAKSAFYAGKIGEMLLDEPRESNTEGGLFPAIFGTVMMVILMSVFSLPFGVIAAVYLREYAREGVIVRLVRIAVNNLAGVPSIVYGVFGLGFFVYGVGSAIDAFFFPQRLPTPTFGTGGILWASLTLALLTVPVVIVSTEEGLAAVPKGLREGSLSLGATKFQTLMKVVLPMATPGIMTGMILAMARAAGEVAPLMLVGVVKLAPSLPIDGTFPFFHMDRKFMHLGFHIYDVGFQSPNVEAAKPMVFVTTLLLLAIVITASSTAIVIRNRMKQKYAGKAF
jgi:phosphate transport system permease protein